MKGLAYTWAIVCFRQDYKDSVNYFSYLDSWKVCG
jgi:hypothetical protein